MADELLALIGLATSTTIGAVGMVIHPAFVVAMVPGLIMILAVTLVGLYHAAVIGFGAVLDG